MSETAAKPGNGAYAATAGEPSQNWTPSLPKAVKAQLERAHAMAREAGIANVPDEDGAAGYTRPEGVSVTPEVTGGEGQFELTPPPETLPEEGSGLLPPTAPPQQADWEQRYSTLQGKYNAEMGELRGQLRMLQDMVQRGGQQQQAPASTPPPSLRHVNPPPTREIPKEDIDAYGGELVEASQRWAEARFAPLLQDWERRLMTIEGQQQQLAQYTASQGIDAQLDRTVPSWRELNNNQAFKDWLTTRERFSGRTYHELANEAYGTGDAARVAAFFQAYQDETRPQPAGGIQQSQTGVTGAMPGGAQAAPLPLTALAVPGRTPISGTPWQAPERRTWQRAHITRFYTDRARGLWRGREAEADAIDREISAAAAEGRVEP